MVREGRGRPEGSSIRQNIVEILFYRKTGYGYEIYKDYCELFPMVTMRSIYYHLNKGTTIGEFKVQRIEEVNGNYSWGGVAQKIYYSLGPNAVPRGDEKIKAHFEDGKQESA
jgi:hypothetical protein